MRIKTALFLAIILLPLQAAAQQESGPAMSSQQQEALKLIEASNGLAIGQQLGSMLNEQIIPQMLASLPPEKRGPVQKILLEEMQTFLKSLEGEMKANIIDLYAKNFTEAELKEINAFYATPTGQKVRRSMPALTQEAAANGLALAKEHMPELMVRIRQRVKALSGTP